MSNLDSLLSELRSFLGDRLSTAPAVRDDHGHDASYHPTRPPDAVAFPATVDEVRRVVEGCGRFRVPVIPFGAGTAVEGGVVAQAGGICIDMRGMNRILRVSPDDLDATVEAGVTYTQLNLHLDPLGLFFPVDPGIQATLGGMAATRASGTNAVRYGTMRENVLALEVVLADGATISTSRRARKSAAGYDLTRMFVGSEGTLGIITGVTVRLQRKPEAISAAVCPFATVKAAVDAVIRTIQEGVPVARIELLDPAQMDAVNRYSGLSEKVAPTLFFEFHGTPAGVREQATTVERIARYFGGEGFRWALDEPERRRLWAARKDAYFAALALRPGAKGYTTDVCVPISRLAECIDETIRDLAECTIPTTLVGHVGDGNFHVLFLIDPARPTELNEAKRFGGRITRRALEMEGTCTGEHGVGIGKIDYLAEEHGPALEVMRRIKSALDPKNIMNPDTVLRIH